jgi:hypothetical protein
MTRRELLRTIRLERARLESTLARLPAEQARGVLAQVGHWESQLVRRLGGLAEVDPYHALMSRLVELSDEELNRPFGREPLWRLVAAVTYEHYWEHAEPLRLRLGRPRSPAPRP